MRRPNSFQDHNVQMVRAVNAANKRPHVRRSARSRDENKIARESLRRRASTAAKQIGRIFYDGIHSDDRNVCARQQADVTGVAFVHCDANRTRARNPSKRFCDANISRSQIRFRSAGKYSSQLTRRIEQIRWQIARTRNRDSRCARHPTLNRRRDRIGRAPDSFYSCSCSASRFSELFHESHRKSRLLYTILFACAETNQPVSRKGISVGEASTRIASRALKAGIGMPLIAAFSIL